MSIGMSKNEVYQDLNATIANAMSKTSVFDFDKYCLYISSNLYNILELWYISDNLISVNTELKHYKGIKIEKTKRTDYFYLEYSKNNVVSIKFRPKTFHAA